MVVLLWILLGLLGLFLVVLAGLIALPVHIRLVAEKGIANRVLVDLQLFGGLAPRLRLVDSTRSRSKATKNETPDPPKEESGKKERKRRKRWRVSAKTGRRMISEVPALIMGEFQRIHIDRLRVDANFGFNDPADTGKVFGLLTPIIYGGLFSKASVNLRPDFTGARFSGRGEVALRLRPGALTIPLIRFGWRVFVR